MIRHTPLRHRPVHTLISAGLVLEDVCECEVVLGRRSVVNLVNTLVIDTLLHRGFIYGLISASGC
jgi:hypothetical protein